MTWIATVSPGDALGELRDTYRVIASARGGVADVHAAQSLNPRALRAHLALYRAVMFQRSSLSRAARERIGVLVSAVHGCAYCVRHHQAALAALGDDPVVGEVLGRGEIPAGLGPDALDPGGESLLRWARQGAAAPAGATQAMIEDLRARGFDDRAILDAALAVAYFSFVNRLVLMLGVNLEPDFETTCRRVAEEPLPGSES
ncbi:MAG: peroxidase-related enzyme [Candidatus Polarisedimenticolia bacterium]